MKKYNIKIIIIIFVFLFSSYLYSSESFLWVELQNNWKSIDNVIIKDHSDYLENKEKLYEVDIFHILEQYDESVKKDNIRVHKVIGKIDRIIDLYIYVRSAIPMISIELNGRNLDFTKPSGNEYLFKIDYSIWEETNLVTLSVPGLGGLSKRRLTPAVFIVRENSIDRIRNLTINITEKMIHSKREVSFNGPFFLKKLDEKEYELFKKNPEQYKFNENSFWRTLVPSDTRHLLKGSYRHKLAYKFYFNYPGTENKKNNLSIGVINGADEVYINKKLIGKTGTPNIPGKSYFDKKRDYPIPNSSINKKGINSVLIITHGITNYASGEILSNNIKLIESDGVIRNIFKEEVIDLIIIITLIVSASFSFLLFNNLKIRIEYFYLTLVLINLAFYLFFNSQIEYLVSDDFMMRKKAEFILLFSLMPLASLFFRFIYRPKHSILEKFLNAMMYINLILQFLLLLVPITSNDITVYHTFIEYLIVTWVISFSYFFLITIREVFYYIIHSLKMDEEEKEIAMEKFDNFFHSARISWNRKMDFLPVKFQKFFQIKIISFNKIIIGPKRESIFYLISLILIVSALVNDYFVIQRLDMGIKLFKYSILVFGIGIYFLIKEKFFDALRNLKVSEK